jgi:hypothetical protein
MKNKLIKEISVAVVLIVLLVLLLNPLHFWMPSMMLVGILVAAVVVFGIFATFILQEKVVDEREDAHRAFAGRVAFLAGSAVLVFAIIIQSFSHSVDPWLVVTFVAMTIAKIGARSYSDLNF